MANNSVFNKDDFADLLKRAKGNRTTNQYASDASVSAAHISRFLRGLLETPPSPRTISKLASKANGNVSYRDFMIAAGHIISNSNETSSLPNDNLAIGENSAINISENILLLEKKFVQIIISDLYNKPFISSVKMPGNTVNFPDLSVEMDYEGYTQWCFLFKSVGENMNSFPKIVREIYGEFAIQELSPSFKYTVAVNSEVLYKQLLENRPRSIRANLFVMLINIDLATVVKEERLCSF